METGNIPFRLKSLRERRNINQDMLAEQLGLKDRQSLSDIELGERKLTADEMVRAASFFGVAIDYFTDPFELAGEGKFSWRQKNVISAELDAFELKAGRWIAAFRHLSRLRGELVNSAERRVGLTKHSSYEDAQAEGESISRALKLGAVPALRLLPALETELDTLVLHVDAIRGVSGAACQLLQLNCILINRRESQGRRNFDAAHEFFHLLTWSNDGMRPERIEASSLSEVTDKRTKRVEELAENFAAALLMPAAELRSYLQSHPLPEECAVSAWLMPLAEQFKVSRTAIMWRLVAIGHLSKAAAERIRDTGSLNNAGA
ncbi:MAG: XRE family transcriptional regulator, partial [Casimicrobium sp.]